MALGVTLLRRALAAGLTVTAVLADAGYGEATVFREALYRLNLPYALGISSHLTVFLETPRVAVPTAATQRGRLTLPVWLLARRPLGRRKIVKYFFIHLPATTALKRLMWIAHQRWAIEQQYQHLKDELGLDHFEGRSCPGWNRHVTLTAVAYTFLQQERPHTWGAPLTFPMARALVGEIFTALYFAANPKQLDNIVQLRRKLPLRI